MINFSEIIDEKIEQVREVNTTHCLEICQSNEPKVGKFHEAPEHHRDNEYIHRGYRINFHNNWNIFKSLFIVHNELVNVWTHIFGVIFAITLIIYTSFYISSHKSEIKIAFENKWEEFNADWKFHSLYLDNFSNDIKHTFQDGKSKINEYVGRFKNISNDYIQSIDEKINQYRQYINEKINCVPCIENIKSAISETSDLFQANFNEIKEKFGLISSSNITIFEFNFNKYIDEMNEKLVKFKNELGSPEFKLLGLPEKLNNNKRLPIWPILVFLFAAIICLSFSAIYHLFFVHSKKVLTILGQLDYAGISSLIAGSCFPLYYYLFYCSPQWLVLYLGIISIFSFIVLCLLLSEEYSSSKKRAIRGTLFLILGISAAFPIIHLLFFPSTIQGLIRNPTFLNWMLGGFSYIIGCLIYINRIPERIWPGKFCLWGSSHQIWHCLVFTGILFHFFASLDSYYDRSNNMSC